jgi:hypothetical protein
VVLLVAAALAGSGCAEEEASTPLGEPLLTFWAADGAGELRIEWSDRVARSGGAESRPFGEAEFEMIEALLAPDRRAVYGADVAINLRPAGERPASPPCDEDATLGVACRALDLAAGEVYLLFLDYREPASPGWFDLHFAGATFLSPETSALLVHLDDLRRALSQRD